MSDETKRIPAERIEEWKRLAEAGPGLPVGYEPIPNGNGAVRCRRCGAVLMPGTEAYDWHGTTGSMAFACRPDEHAFTAAAREALPALLSERESLLSVLREVEFAGNSAVFECPVCRGTWDDKVHFGRVHAPDCRLAAFLKET